MSERAHIHADADDASLIRAIAAGSEAALNILIERYYASLTSWVLRYVDSQDLAEDIVQDLFVRLWQRKAILQESGSLRAYLYTAARNAAFDANKRLRTWERKIHESTTAAWISEGSMAGTDHAADMDELEQAIADAIAMLPEKTREVFLLSRNHDLSNQEIAATLGIAQSTVRTQLARALKLLEKRLGSFLSLAIVVL